MMKKLVLAALGAALFVGAADAQVRVKYDNVRFITSAAANGGGGIVDSLTARRVGAILASSVLDTTQAISTQNWMFFNPVVLADTTNQFCTLIVYDAQGSEACESGADSLAVAMQVSANGEDWFTSAAITGQTVSAGTGPIVSRNNQTIANGAFMDRLSLNGAALANGQPAWLFRFKLRGAQSFHDVAEGSTQFWPFIRFVLSFHDAKGYMVQAKLGHYEGTNPNSF